jgi:hypothetical protein
VGSERDAEGGLALLIEGSCGKQHEDRRTAPLEMDQSCSPVKNTGFIVIRRGRLTRWGGYGRAKIFVADRGSKFIAD